MNEDKATRYHRLRRRALAASAAWGVVLLAGVLLSGLSRHLSDAASALVAGLPAVFRLPATVCVWVTAVFAVYELGALPLSFYSGFTLERRYGLSRQRAASWAADHVRSAGVQLVFAVAAAAWVSASLRVWPAAWWVVAWAGAVAAAVAAAWAAPVLLLPLFHTFVPLENAGLRQRLTALAERAGVSALGIFEWRLSGRSSRANAALTGIGATRRIIVSDTLVTDYQADEVEIILAHELAHHVHQDIWRSLAADALAGGLAFALSDVLLRAAAVPLGLRGIADVAGLPVVALTGMATGWLVSPAMNAASRAHERRADRFALDLTRNADAFIRAMQRLGARNLAEQAPTWLARVLFHTHPPISDRLAAARAWAADQAGGPAMGGEA
jgi:STE24 endopeptidase